MHPQQPLWIRPFKVYSPPCCYLQIIDLQCAPSCVCTFNLVHICFVHCTSFWWTLSEVCDICNSAQFFGHFGAIWSHQLGNIRDEHFSSSCSAGCVLCVFFLSAKDKVFAHTNTDFLYLAPSIDYTKHFSVGADLFSQNWLLVWPGNGKT